MSDTQKGEEVVEETTQANPEPEPTQEEVATPQAKEKPAESETAEETQSNEEVEDSTPKDNKAWAAMRVENKKLKEQLEETGVDAEYLEQLKNVTRGQDVKGPNPQAITEDTEYGTAIQGINEARQLAYQTRQELAQLKRERLEAEDREAENAYPGLKSDQLFQQMVAEKRLASEVMGRHRPTIEIAREVDKILSRRGQQVQAQATEEAERRQAEKQTATAQPQTSTSQGNSGYDSDSVRKGVRKGDRTAQTEMAKGIIADLDF